MHIVHIALVPLAPAFFEAARYEIALASLCGLAARRVVATATVADAADYAAVAAVAASYAADGRRRLQSQAAPSPAATSRIRALIRPPADEAARIANLLHSATQNVSTTLAIALGLSAAENVTFVRTALVPGIVPRPDPPPMPRPPPLPPAPLLGYSPPPPSP